MSGLTLRRQRLAERLHDLGPRVVLELLLEIGRVHDIADDVDARLEGFAALDAEALRFFGGDTFPPSIFAVPR